MIIKTIHGKSQNEMFGTGIGALIMGLAVMIIMHAQGALSGMTITLSIVSGAAWAIGMLGQYVSFRKLGVSKTIPISTGLQLVGTSLIGVLAFGEWQGLTAKSIGAAAIILLVFGAYTISRSGQASGSAGIGAYVPLILTTIGYWVYSALPKLITANGIQVFTLQMIGICLVALIYAFSQDRRVAKQKASWANAVPGMIYGLAAFAYIFAARRVGVTTAYIVGQMSVVISTLGGIYILHEHKQGKELLQTLVGLALILVGSLTTAFI